MFYRVFIWAMLVFSDIVWDECSEDNADKLEKLQCSAARIVTCLPGDLTMNIVVVRVCVCGGGNKTKKNKSQASIAV